MVANGEVNGAPLPPVELLSYYFLLVVAGNETTRNAMTGGMLAFLENPGEWQKLRRDPALLDSAVEEIVRWTTPVIQFSRTATRDYELRGKTIRTGQSVCLFYASGNRDEEVFDDPFAFRIDRQPNPHIGFGMGEHVCLGAHLARLELRHAFAQLRERLESCELSRPGRARALELRRRHQARADALAHWAGGQLELSGQLGQAGVTTPGMISASLPVCAIVQSVDREAEAQRLAKTYVWWQEPTLTLADPRKLLRQILRYGRPEDYVAAEEIWGRDMVRQALVEARRGEIDPKSEHFWRLRFELPPSVVAERAGEPLKLSFFGGITFGRVGEPIRIPGRPSIASRLDLLGTKLATITQRIETRDYLDIAALLASGLTINDGVAALLALYGKQASGLQSVKTIAWFKDGGLDTSLPTDVKDRLMLAAAQYDPRTPPAPKLSHRLD